jgi:hypothetical protein
VDYPLGEDLLVVRTELVIDYPLGEDQFQIQLRYQHRKLESGDEEELWQVIYILEGSSARPWAKVPLTEYRIVRILRRFRTELLPHGKDLITCATFIVHPISVDHDHRATGVTEHPHGNFRTWITLTRRWRTIHVLDKSPEHSKYPMGLAKYYLIPNGKNL